MKIAESLIKVKENSSTAMVITNTGNSACQLQKGMDLGQVFVCELVDIANQLKKMRVIAPSKSPWSSPVVLVSKRMEHYDFAWTTMFSILTLNWICSFYRELMTF